MNNLAIKKIVLAGLFLALGLVMPLITGQIPSLGNALLPMHIPVLLAGFVLGGPYGGCWTPHPDLRKFLACPMSPRRGHEFELAAMVITPL